MQVPCRTEPLVGRTAKRILITDGSVARLARSEIEAGYVVRDRDVRGFIVKVGIRRKTFRYEGEQRQGGKRKVISRKLGEYAIAPIARGIVKTM
jgi:hypothetical protein